MKNELKVGIVGAPRGSGFVRAIQTVSETALVAICDINREVLEQRADQFGVEERYTEYAEMADADLDIIVIATPMPLHVPQAVMALEKGKHVLLEKPVARNVGEVQKMIALRRDRVVAVCSPRYAFSANAAAAAKCVATGVLGKIRVVRVRAILGVSGSPSKNPPPWRQSMEKNGGGILVNWSCYDLDYLMSSM